MRAWILSILVCSLLSFPAPVRAQGELTFDQVAVHLWPEFDRPAMLVMLELTLSPTVSLPRDLDVRIPASATVNVVALGENHDMVSDRGVDYATSLDGGWNVVTIRNVASRAVRIEYYDPLEIHGTARHYTYQWSGEAATAVLTILFQQPVGASGLQITPLPVGNFTDANGLVYYQVNFQALRAGDQPMLSADYVKTTTELSVSVPEVQPITPLGSGLQGQVSLANALPWMVGALGLVLILVGLGFGMTYWRQSGRQRVPRQRQRAEKVGKGTVSALMNCPLCGHRLQPGDLFCRACGTRLDGKP